MIDIHKIQVGDYLQNTNGNVGRVIGVRPYMGTAPSMKYDYEVIMQYHQTWTVFSDPKILQPIPITPEILEKNGFEKTPCGMGKTILTFSDDYSAISIDEITDSIWRVEYMNREFSLPLCRELICHVHELQQFLRLCGINLEIKL